MQNKSVDINQVINLLNHLVEDPEAYVSVKFMKKNKNIINEPQMSMDLKRSILKMQLPYIEKELMLW